MSHDNTTTETPKVQLTMTVLAVTDLKRSVAFYKAAFDWPVRIEAPVLVEFELPGGGGLAVYQREYFSKNTGETPQATPATGTTTVELYFCCADLKSSMMRMSAAGGRLISPLADRPWGDEAAYYADPDGNVLVLSRQLKQYQ